MPAPFLLMAAGLGMKAGGGILGAIGVTKAADAEAKGYENAASSALFAAERKKDEGSYQAWRDNLTTQRILGSAEGQFANAGVVTTTGSALDFITDSLRELTLEKMVKERNIREETRNLETQADYYTLAAKNARSAGKLNAFASLLGAGSDMVGMGMQASAQKT